jgi:hypothetical protein
VSVSAEMLKASGSKAISTEVTVTAYAPPPVAAAGVSSDAAGVPVSASPYPASGVAAPSGGGVAAPAGTLSARTTRQTAPCGSSNGS